MSSPPPPLEADLRAYSAFWSAFWSQPHGEEPPLQHDGPTFERFWSFCSEIPDCFARAQQMGHCTGSAWITDPTGSSTLLLKHPFLGRWLQPGGHADGSSDLWQVAHREAHEETGLTLEDLLPAGPLLPPGGHRCRPIPLDLDIHAIPARGSEPEHHHYDLRYWFVADPSLPLKPEASGIELAWVPTGQLETYTQEDSVLRLAQKVRRLMALSSP